MTVARIDPLNVEVIVPAAHFGALRNGSTAKVVLDQPVGGTYTAKVVIIDQVIDAASGTFGVRLELPNPRSALPASNVTWNSEVDPVRSLPPDHPFGRIAEGLESVAGFAQNGIQFFHREHIAVGRRLGDKLILGLQGIVLAPKLLVRAAGDQQLLYTLLRHAVLP